MENIFIVEIKNVMFAPTLYKLYKNYTTFSNA